MRDALKSEIYMLRVPVFPGYGLYYQPALVTFRPLELDELCPMGSGEVSEWLKEPVSKTGEPSRVPWVRIPPSPFFSHTTPYPRRKGGTLPCIPQPRRKGGRLTGRASGRGSLSRPSETGLGPGGYISAHDRPTSGASPTQGIPRCDRNPRAVG